MKNGAEAEETAPPRRKANAHWAALIKKVYEADPLLCPKCCGQMKIIAFLEKRDQAEVIRRMLTHCGLWRGRRARAPPTQNATRRRVQPDLEFSDPPDFDFMQDAPPDEAYFAQPDPGDDFSQAI